MDDNRLFWVHIEGEGALKNAVKIQVLTNYLKNFNILFTKIAKFKHFISLSFPEKEFQLYLRKIRKDCVAIGVKQFPKRAFETIDGKSPHDEIISKIEELLIEISGEKGYNYIKNEFKNPDERISLLDSLRKLGPYDRENQIMITLNKLSEDFDKSVLKVRFDRLLVRTIEKWISEEIKHIYPSITGHFLGFKIFKKKINLWLRSLIGIEIVCEIPKGTLIDEINSLKINDRVKIFGEFKDIPGKKINVRKIYKIIKLEPPELLTLSDIEGIFQDDVNIEKEFLNDLPLIWNILKQDHEILYLMGED